MDPKIDGLMNFSATSPLEFIEFVKLMTSIVTRAQRDQRHESCPEIVMVQTDISKTHFHAPCKEVK